MHKPFFGFYFLFFLASHCLLAQNPVATFSAPNSACLSETIMIGNASSNATGFIWDFCHEDIKSIPTVALSASLPTTAGSYYHSIKIVFDKGEWVGFCTNMNGNKFYRLDFGSSLSNTPTIVDLGVPTGFSSPASIDLIEAGGVWYAFVLNIWGNSLLRVRFGNGLKATPTLSEDLGNMSGQLNTPSGVKILYANGKYYVYVANYGLNTVSVIDFDSSPQNVPVATKTIGGVSVFNGPYGISLISQGNLWYGLVGSLNVSKTYKLDFGTNPFSDPIITEIIGIPQGVDLEFVLEGQQYYGLARTESDGIYRIDFGTDLSVSSPTVTRLGSFGVLSVARSLNIVRDTPGWKAFTVNASTGELYHIDFLGSCSSQMSLNTSVSQTPSNFFYKAPGNYTIELTAYNALGQRSIASSSINVSNLISSGVSATQSIEQCAGSMISFTAASTATITSYNWDFGDGFSSTSGAIEQHQYNSAGNYTLSLTAIEQNGCSNHFSKTVSVYAAPQPGFALPTVTGKSCTLQNYPFQNQTVVDPLANTTWKWFVDGQLKSSGRDFNYSFQSTGTYQISLQSDIPGCSSTFNSNFLVEAAGASVDFTFANQCHGDLTQFTNTTTGNADGYSWSFGDGNSSTAINPDHTFSGIGSYPVQLTASNLAGCNNSNTKTVTIVSKPSPNFFIDLPPFSCSGYPSQFHDATPSLTDSNIVSWDWAFHDGSSATSGLKDPVHTFSSPGTYSVDLKATTNYGCAATVQLPVEILASPNADFSYTAACLNKPTQIQAANAPGIQSWSWVIGNNFYSVSNPAHTFTAAGIHPVTLNVKGSNNCEAIITKPIEVKPAPALNYSTSSACTNRETIFTDLTTGADLPISWVWDFGNGNTANNATSSFIFPSAGTFPVNLSVVTQSGCGYSLSKNVTVVPAPIASFTESVSFGPPPLPVQFTNASLYSSSFLWKFGDLSSSTSVAQNPFFTFSELGDYLVELTATNSVGCSDTYSKSIKVVLPVVDIGLEILEVQRNFSTNSLTPIITVRNYGNVKVPMVDLLVTVSSGARVKTNLQVDIAPGTVAEWVVPLELFSKENYLCVELTTLNDIQSENNAACKSLSDYPVVRMPWPNPTTGQISFETILTQSGSGTLRVFNSLGQLVYNQEFLSLASGMNRVELDFSGNSPGLYVAIWELNGQKTEFRFVLQ